MELLLPAIALLVGVAIGAAGYRYMLKRNPEKLEQWAAEAKSLGKRL